MFRTPGGQGIMEYGDIMFEIVNRKIVKATHIIEGRIDNEFRLTLDDGRVLVFSAERSEFGLKLEDANCVEDVA